MARFFVGATALAALVLVANFCVIEGKPGKRQEAEEDVTIEADLKITVNGEQAVLVCGEPTTVEGRRKGKGKQIPLHEAPDEACQTLQHVDDLQAELKPPPPGSDPCVQEEQEPEEVKIEGRFKGKTVNYKRSFRNKCQLEAVAPELFDIKGEETQGRRKKGRGKK